jgi:hypothetical protein
MFFGKDQPHEGIDWWKVIAKYVNVKKIEGKLGVGWKSGQSESLVNFLAPVEVK